ncbi:MAG: protein-methionine-sulfoxide reductase catalytic subunit MsrP [Alphaproteobacteria bacterium]|nr:protein-methionine-sulfoxide reductase catalytic subunit MsrP [Alphaproteobacteria bacterium]
MLLKSRRGWELPERAATPEGAYMNRREFALAAAAGPILAAAGPALRAFAADDPSAKLYPVKRNEKYVLDRNLTDEKFATSYNNFYEFGSHKGIAKAAQALPVRPWTVVLDGMVEKEQTVDIDTLLKAMPLEERLYRHRCVEAWSMAVPWSGFPLAKLVEFAKPKSGAKYLRMESLADKATMPGLKEFWYPWPYVEGLTIEEATNELAFLATGMYGKPIPPQNGAMLRLATPWKYGFKSIKSIVKFTFTNQRPKTFWETLAPNEYGFWANVHPAVRHPRWSQAAERVLGTDEMMETMPFNGYEEFVGEMYPDRNNDPKLFM